MQNFLKCISFATLMLLQDATASSVCPEYCTCEGAEFNCHNAALTSVPVDLERDAVDLDLSFNNISIINNNAFDNLPHLRTINLSDNGIEVIEPEVFKWLQDLKHVDLHNNNISFFHPSLLEDNLNLTFLDLSENNIQSFKPDFKTNTELKFLNLSQNVLSFQDLTTFLPIASLEILDLSNNQIESFSDEVLNGMVNLERLDISGNQLEYDCRLKTVWTLCLNQNVTCVTEDVQSWKMVDNLNCETEEEPEFMSLTDGLMDVNETNSEDIGAEGSGSGMDPTESNISENGVEATSGDQETAFDGDDSTADDDSTLIVIIVASVCCVIVLIIVAVICICRRIRSRDNTTGNLSRTNSIDYLNQEDEFNKSYKNSRNDSHRNRNHYDRVIPPEFNRHVLQFQVGDNVAAEVVRVPSFKTRGVATPLNLPQEIPAQETGLVIQNKGARSSQHAVNSLSRSTPSSSYEENTTVRVGSLKKYAKPTELTKPTSRYNAQEEYRVPSIKRT